MMLEPVEAIKTPNATNQNWRGNAVKVLRRRVSIALKETSDFGHRRFVVEWFSVTKNLAKVLNLRKAD